MSFFKKIFGSSNDSSNPENQSQYNPSPESQSHLSIDEQFTLNFKKNGGKFLYCENITELNEQFENILQENDWFETEALCLEAKLFQMLKNNNIFFDNPHNPTFLLASCENLIAQDGSVMLSSNQIKQHKTNDLPTNIILVALASHIVANTSEGLREIKKRYTASYPTNITTINYFDKVKEKDFLHYGSTPKNLYLLLLEDS